MKWLYNTHLSTRIILTLVTAGPLLIISAVVIGNNANVCAPSASTGPGYSADNRRGLNHLNLISRSTALILTVSAGPGEKMAAQSEVAADFVELTDCFQNQTTRFGRYEPEESLQRV